MIDKKPAFWIGDVPFKSREAAQQHELETLLGDLDTGLLNPGTPTPVNVEAVADWIAKHRDQILGILATRKPRTPKAKPAKKLKATPPGEPKFSGPVHAT